MTDRDIKNIKCSHPSWEHLSFFQRKIAWFYWRNNSDPFSDETFDGYIKRNPTDEMIRVSREVIIDGLD